MIATRKPLSMFTVVTLTWLAAPAKGDEVTLEPLGVVLPPEPLSEVLDEAAAEIVAHDPRTQRLFIVNVFKNRIEMADISDPSAPAYLGAIDLAPYGASPTCVAVRKGTRELAVSVASDPRTNPGKVVFFTTDGRFLAAVTVGALPDMLTYTHDGTRVVVANEGEPSDDYTVDPEGSVSIIDVGFGARWVRQRDVRTVDFRVFNGMEDVLRTAGVRIFGPGASAAQDFEPEFLTLSSDSRKAWVTLQENNAIAEIDIRRGRVTNLIPLGYKDHTLPRNKLDASDRDGKINVANWPVKGMYLPDAIAYHKGFLLTANEGDTRAWAGFNEETRVGSVTLDPTAFPNAAELKLAPNLGRLRMTSAPPSGKGADGVFSEIYAFGARSFSIWSVGGDLMFDSGDEIEQLTAFAYPSNFNSNHAANEFDTRSDDKGPEPEGLALGTIRGCTYAFIALERIGGVAVYNITNPRSPVIAGYKNTRDFAGDPKAGTAGDLGPEGVIFIPRWQSPIGAPLLVLANEVSGTTRLFKVVTEGHCFGDEDDDE